MTPTLLSYVLAAQIIKLSIEILRVVRERANGDRQISEDAIPFDQLPCRFLSSFMFVRPLSAGAEHCINGTLLFEQETPALRAFSTAPAFRLKLLNFEFQRIRL
jgi:hypothetical protein